MNRRAPMTTVPRISQQTSGACSVPAPVSSALRPFYFIARRQAPRIAGYGEQCRVTRRAWFTRSLLEYPDMLQAAAKGSAALWFQWRPDGDFLQQERFRREPSLRIFPAPPRSLAPCLSRALRHVDVLLRLRRPTGLGFQRKISLRLRPKVRARSILRSLRRKHISTLGAGHLASLRAGVSRGQSGQIQTGEMTWHSTKTT